MDDLRQRFAALNDIRMPELWDEVERRAETLRNLAPAERLAPAPPMWRGTIAGRSRGSSRPIASRRTIALLVAAAITVALIGGAIAAGSVFVHRPETSPTPETAPTPSASLTQPAMGGGLLLVRDAVPTVVPPDPQDFTDGTYNLYTLDIGTGTKTLLGTVPYHWATSFQPEFQWAADRKHVLITDRKGGVWGLSGPTDAGRPLVAACCGQPNTADWVLSPRGDLIAGLHSSTVTVPGQDGPTDLPDAVVISAADGTGVRTRPLPEGLHWDASGIAWSPDESAIAIATCGPCNYAPPRETPTGVDHEHLYIVPVDGSPIRDLIDDTQRGFFGPTWSPDGASILVVRKECMPGTALPGCQPSHSLVTVVSLTGGGQSVVADAPDLRSAPALSPDGRRIAYSIEKIPAGQDPVDEQGGVFVMDTDGGHLTRLSDGFDPRWSPDNKWLLFTKARGGDVWIVAVDGGELRPIGTFGAVAW
ncbi:MAG: hypothetical protein ABI553_03625 [Chloroflexota bacterium]